MAMPVSQDNYLYCREGFYVTVGGHRHPRARSADLYSLLTWVEPPPRLTKAGKVAKRQPPPHKDPPAHYYIAQVIHYGLKECKTKEAAKKRLLASFGPDQQIKVPDNILKLERELRQRFKAADEKWWKEHEELERKREIEEARKRQEEKSRYERMMKDMLDDEGDSLDGADDQSAKEGKGKNKRKKGPSQNGRESKRKSLDDLATMGRFEMVVPYISEQWPDAASGELTLELALSAKGSHLWGRFDFGMLTGIVRSKSSSKLKNLSTGSTIMFQWRGAQEGTGEMTFDEDNTLIITFIGNGKIKGKLFWSEWSDEGFDLCGKQDTETLRKIAWMKHVRTWKREWRGYNSHNYEVANVARWGKWGGDEESERPAESDTTDGGPPSEGDGSDEDFDQESFSDDYDFGVNVAF